MNADPLFYDIKEMHPFKRYILKYLLNTVDGVVFIQGSLDDLELTYVQDIPYFVARPFIENTLFQTLSTLEPKYLKKSFVYIGRLSWEKNIEAMIEYFIDLHTQDPEVVLNIVGDGPLREKIEDKVRGVDYINVVWRVDDIPTVYRQNHFLLLFSIYDSFPVVVLEAIAAWLIPIVSINVGTKILLPEDLIIDLDAPKDQVVRSITSVINHPSRYIPFLENSKKVIEQKYLRDRNIERFSEEYNILLQKIYHWNHDLYYRSFLNVLYRKIFWFLKLLRLIYLEYIIKRLPYGIKKIQRNDVFLQEENFKKNCIPNWKRSVFLLSFDDFSPKTEESWDFDFWGNIGKGVNKLFFDFFKKYWFLKATFFVSWSSAYVWIWGLYKTHHTAYRISNPEFRDWQKFIKSKDFSSRIEIANHWLYHLQNDRYNFFVNNEYSFKNKEEIRENLKENEKIFADIWLKCYGMRPPAYGIDYDLHLVDELKNLGYKYIAFSTPQNWLNDRKKLVSNIYPSKVRGMWNIPENISLSESYDRIIQKIDNIIQRNGIIHIKWHYIMWTKWLKNWITKSNLNKLWRVLDYLQGTYPWEILYDKILDFVYTLKNENHW